MFKKVAASAILAASLGLGASAKAAEMPKELNFGIISTESASALEASFRPFLDDLQDYMGIPVKSFFASDYAGVIEGMRFDKVDVAWFGNKSAIEAVDRAGVLGLLILLLFSWLLLLLFLFNHLPPPSALCTKPIQHLTRIVDASDRGLGPSRLRLSP